MALRAPSSFNLIYPPKSLKPQNPSITFQTLSLVRLSFKISCKGDTSDAELAAGLAVEMAKINSKLVQKEAAMKKSRELLFKEFCKHRGLKAEEVKQLWSKMGEDEKMVWSKGFVSDWGEAFHPLSSKSVKELVEEILIEENSDPNSDNPSSSLFNLDTLKKMIGFS